MKREEWREIAGYDGAYMVSDAGRVRNGERLKAQRKHGGYMYVSLWRDGKEKNCLVHRLVARAFLPNPDELPEINHKDENKENNRVENLEWCTQLYNNMYGTRRDRFIASRGKPVQQMTMGGEIVAQYRSANEAARETGLRQSAISNACNGVYKQAYGYLWSYC